MSIAYLYDGTLYLAVTRRCSLRCTFCPKTHGRWTVAGNDLRYDPEPSAAVLLEAAARLGTTSHREVAFVGLGEPTMRLDVVVEVGRALRARAERVRLVTDGLASLRHGTDVSGRLEGAVDEVNVSLNAADPATYVQLCPNPFGEAAHAAACDFIRRVQAHVPVVKATAVAAPSVDMDAVRVLAERLGVGLRVRPYFDPVLGEPHEPPVGDLPHRAP